MEIKTVTYTETYKMFEVGERIRPTSPRCSLEPGEYIVTKCIAPLFAGEESVVFVEGHKYGISTEYLEPVS